MEMFTVPTFFPYLPANHKSYRFFIFQVFSKIQPRHFYNNNFLPRNQIIIIVFQRATIITIMAAGLQKDEFYSYIGRLRHSPNSINYMQKQGKTRNHEKTIKFEATAVSCSVSPRANTTWWRGGRL